MRQRQKKNRKQDIALKLIILLTAILNLITTLLNLISELNE